VSQVSLSQAFCLPSFSAHGRLWGVMPFAALRLMLASASHVFRRADTLHAPALRSGCAVGVSMRRSLADNHGARASDPALRIQRAKYDAAWWIKQIALARQ
jgi:hypothetical protein